MTELKLLYVKVAGCYHVVIVLTEFLVSGVKYSGNHICALTSH